MLELLINAGSEINARNIVGDAPLHKAALNGRARSADFLIKAGANVNIRNEFAQTPLHAACVSGNIEVVQRLVQGGADTSAQDAAEVRKRGAEPRARRGLRSETRKSFYLNHFYLGRFDLALARHPPQPPGRRDFAFECLGHRLLVSSPTARLLIRRFEFEW